MLFLKGHLFLFCFVFFLQKQSVFIMENLESGENYKEKNKNYLKSQS